MELCDDGNLINGDGCNDKCQVENGWNCEGRPKSECTPECGDEIRLGNEVCDGLGCDNCKGPLLGYDCSNLNMSSSGNCEPICKDGLVVIGEVCDAGDGKGCDDTCDGPAEGWNCP